MSIPKDQVSKTDAFVYSYSVSTLKGRFGGWKTANSKEEAIADLSLEYHITPEQIELGLEMTYQDWEDSMSRRWQGD